MSNFKFLFMQFQINLRVDRKVPSNENMKSFYPLTINGKNAGTVYHSAPKERAVKAYLIPSDIAAFQQLPKSQQKKIRHQAMSEIQKRLGWSNAIAIKSRVFSGLCSF